MLKNRGAALALAGLIALPVIGFSFFDQPHCYENHEACVGHHNQATPKDEPSLFLVMGAWGSANRDAIDAWGVIGSFLSAFALVLFTAILSAKTSGLYRETAALRKIADQQRTDMLRSIKASENSADAAKMSATALIAAERAYVSVKNPSSSLRFDSTTRSLDSLRVWVTWKNSGSTPASPMKSLIGATFIPNANEFSFPEPGGEEENVQPLVLGPDAEIDSGTIDIGAMHVQATADLTGHQFVWGWAIYRDVFPNSEDHVIEFCYKVSIDGPLTADEVRDPTRVRFSIHGNRNRYYNKPINQS